VRVIAVPRSDGHCDNRVMSHESVSLLNDSLSDDLRPPDGGLTGAIPLRSIVPAARRPTQTDWYANSVVGLRSTPPIRT